MASVRQEEVVILTSVVDACAGYTRNAVVLRAHYALSLTLGGPDAWERHSLLIEEQ